MRCDVDASWLTAGIGHTGWVSSRRPLWVTLAVTVLLTSMFTIAMVVVRAPWWCQRQVADDVKAIESLGADLFPDARKSVTRVCTEDYLRGALVIYHLPDMRFSQVMGRFVGVGWNPESSNVAVSPDGRTQASFPHSTDAGGQRQMEVTFRTEPVWRPQS